MSDSTERKLGVTREKQIRRDVLAYIGDAGLRQYQAINPLITFRDALVIWLGFTAIFALVYNVKDNAAAMAIIMPFLLILSGALFNWINVQIHEASHFLLLDDRKKNDSFCNFAMALWALQDIGTYRYTHLDHHLYLHQEKDPDFFTYTANTGSIAEVFKGILRDLTFFTFLERAQFMSKTLATAPAELRQQNTRTLYLKLGFQILIVLLLCMVFGPLVGLLSYVVLFLYPLLAVFPVFVRIRTVVQHYSPGLEEPKTPEALDTFFVSRTTEAGWLESFLVGAKMDYHFEHHLFPSLPYYQLKKLHRHLIKAGYFGNGGDHKPDFRTDNYLRFFKSVAGSDPAPKLGATQDD